MLIKLEILPGEEFLKPAVSLASNVPLLVIEVFVPFAVFTATFVLSIVTPESTVTLEPSPSISKSLQFEEMVSVEPDTTEQSAANKCLL